METKELKIQLTGPSGVGKTTLAKWISESYGIPFISGSYSDLVPETKMQKHSDMISKDPSEIFRQDNQVLNRRHKLFSKASNFVSDRSYVDSAAYMIQKLSHLIPECVMEEFLNTCHQLLAAECTHLIVIPFSKQFVNGWNMEDNKKRVLNRYYQYEVSSIIDSLVRDFYGLEIDHLESFYMSAKYGYIPYDCNHIKVLYLDEMDFEKRKRLVETFLAL